MRRPGGPSKSTTMEPRITLLTLGILAAFTKLLDIYCQLELARAHGKL